MAGVSNQRLQLLYELNGFFNRFVELPIACDYGTTHLDQTFRRTSHFANRIAVADWLIAIGYPDRKWPIAK
jgi:hypothetical protein